ncbi:hypothetical protein D1B31_11390 [Neobacillus notoginsengisoli]|uniref:DUF4367 domain-containing protein n=2 Tax=Neobacillus notoginsengisoli TaxID=1578198 RepID=A0A417YUC2_9BACI|nr:hypothetical protein D1B31_11390 [Neobacillus notoginsengisoli]
MRIVRKGFVTLLMAVFLLGGCSNASYEDKSKQAVEAAKAAFEEKSQNTNKNTGEIGFYLPFGFEIKEGKPNNIILKNGSKTYILFYNQNESKESKVVYEASVAQYEELETDEQFQGKGKLGFILIERLEDDMNILTAGVGGVKITTETKTSSLDEEAKTLMQIANSVEFKK